MAFHLRAVLGLGVGLFICVACIPRFDTSRDCKSLQDCFKGERCDVIKGCVDIDGDVPEESEDEPVLEDAHVDASDASDADTADLRLGNSMDASTDGGPVTGNSTDALTD